MRKPFMIFDLDGTLVDSLPGIAGSLNRSLQGHGLPGHSNDAVRSFVGDGLHNLIRRSVYSGAEPGLLDSLLRFFKADYAVSWKDGTAPYPGIHDLLLTLKDRGFRMAVLSNKTDDFTVEIVAAVFPKAGFERVLGLRDGMAAKPDPAGALEVATAAGVTAGDCQVIGDSTMDLETATNAGMEAVAVTWGYHDRARLQAAGARRMIDKPAELLEMKEF